MNPLLVAGNPMGSLPPVPPMQAMQAPQSLPPVPVQQVASGTLPPIQPMTIDQRVAGLLGLDPTIERGAILPMGRDANGEMVLAWPQMAVDSLKSLMLPGHVMKGGSFTPRDVTEMALDVGMLSSVVPAPAGAKRMFGGKASKKTADLPMDEASRMARDIADRFDTAQRNAALPVEKGGLGLPANNTADMRAAALGYDTDAYHATRSMEPIDSFKPGMWGSTYLAATPKRAEIGASAGAQELAHLSSAADRVPSPSVRAVMPLRVRGDDIATLRPPRKLWDALPEYADEAQISSLAEKVGGNNWWDVYDEIQVKAPKWDKNDNLIDPGKFKYKKRPYPEQKYTSDAKPWQHSSRVLPGYNSGSDTNSLARVGKDGQHAFIVSDEAGTSIVANPATMPIRSRFAAFDPAKRDRTDILASYLGVPGIGALDAMPQDQQQRDQQIVRGLLNY